MLSDFIFEMKDQTLPWSRDCDDRLFGGTEPVLRRYSPDYFDFQLFYERFLKHASQKQDPSAGSSSSTILPSFDSEESQLRHVLSLFHDFQSRSRLQKNITLLRSRIQLPVSRFRNALSTFLHSTSDSHVRGKVLVVAADTGAGKSTQVPQLVAEMGFKVVCTQPRRIACISLASRVRAEVTATKSIRSYLNQNPIEEDKILSLVQKNLHNNEMDVKTWFKANLEADHVGYQIRFDGAKSRHTKVMFVTEGVLLRQLASDPLLSRYNVVIVDEVHERHIQSDLIVALLKRILREREDLKVILMSATMNCDLFSKYFDDAKVIEVPGKMYPVDVHYLPCDEEDVST